MLAGCARGLVLKAQPRLIPIGLARPDRARHEASAAGGADVVKQILNTIAAVCTLVGADVRIR